MSVRNTPDTEIQADLPPPSALAVLVRVYVCSYLKTAHLKPKQRASAWMREASAMLATEQSVALLFPIRPAGERARVSRVHREALALHRALLPNFTACLPLLEGE